MKNEKGLEKNLKEDTREQGVCSSLGSVRDTDSEIVWRMAEEAIWKMPTSTPANTAYAGHLQAHTYLRRKGQGRRGPSFCFQPREPQGAELWGSEQESKLTHVTGPGGETLRPGPFPLHYFLRGHAAQASVLRGGVKCFVLLYFYK